MKTKPREQNLPKLGKRLSLQVSENVTHHLKEVGVFSTEINDNFNIEVFSDEGTTITTDKSL